MSAPMSRMGDLIGNSMDWIKQQPQLSELGHGIGLSYDLARNAPMNAFHSIPMYEHEEETKNAAASNDVGNAGPGAGSPSGVPAAGNGAAPASPAPDAGPGY